MSAESSKPASGARIVEVSSDDAGQRLDNFLLARLKGAPRSLVYRIVRGGEVRVNSGRVKPDRRLEAGDKVRVPPVRLAERDPAVPPRGLCEELAGRILFENDGLLVIDKPSGLAVHGGSGLSLGLIEALRAMRPDCKSLELVHRLDRDTSGCVMVAKKRAVLRHLHEGLREGKVRKRYLALVRGRWPASRARVAVSLEKNTLSSGERVVRADDAGKRAETLFRVVSAFAEATLLEASPVTGRTHQIRVHAQVSGHPIAGDDKYGDRDFDKQMRAHGLRRVFLHAASLAFSLPSGETVEVSAPLDPALAAVLESLGS
jgi:23S rRNA pseudouridine955/2504/2580 synthase